MKRRDFLKAAAAAPIASALPAVAVIDQPMTATEVQALTEAFVTEYERQVERLLIYGQCEIFVPRWLMVSDPYGRGPT